jgi:putative FmdB family regulatory protein
MPIYEYRCQQCDHELERIQRMSDEPLRDCPACNKPELLRLVSAAGFRLKGGGWYETDFKQGQKRNLADSGKDGSGPPSDSGNGASKPAETKPAASKSTKSDSKPAKAEKSNSA